MFFGVCWSCSFKYGGTISCHLYFMWLSQCFSTVCETETDESSDFQSFVYIKGVCFVKHRDAADGTGRQALGHTMCVCAQWSKAVIGSSLFCLPGSVLTGL